MATSRIPKLAGNDFENMVTWFNTMNSLGFLFHPDDDPSDIVDIKSGVRVFNDEEAQELQVIMAELFETHGARVYDGAAPAFEQVLGETEVSDVAEVAVEKNVKNFVRRTDMDSNNKNQEMDLAAIKTALERGQYGIELMIQNAREPSSWDDDLEVINAQLAIVNAALAKPVVQEVTAEAFDVNKHCEGIALGRYLDSYDESATFDAIIEALNTGGRADLDELDITVNSEFDNEDHATIANNIEEMRQMLIDNISYVQSQVSVNVATVENKPRVEFDLNAYCEGIALGEILNSWDMNASFDDIVSVLHNEDEGEIERLDIVVVEQFEREDYSTIGDMLAEARKTFFDTISFAHAQMANDDLSVYRDAIRAMETTKMTVQFFPDSNQWAGQTWADNGDEVALEYDPTPLGAINKCFEQSRGLVLSDQAVASVINPPNVEEMAQRKVLEEFLGSDATGRFDEIVEVIESEDEDRLEEMNILLSDDYMNLEGEHAATLMRRMEAVLIESLQEALKAAEPTAVVHQSLISDVRSLCKAVEDGDPQTISDRMLNVQGQLPPLSKQEVLDDLGHVWANKYAYQEGLDVEGWFQLIVEAGAKPIGGNSNEVSSFTWASEQEALQKLSDMSGTERDELFERVIDYRENNYLFVLDVFKTDTGAFETLGRDVELANVFSQASAHVAQANWERSGGELAPFDLRDTDSNVVGRGFILSASPRANREKLEELKANKPDDGVQVVIDVEKLLLSVRNPYDNWYKPLASEIQRVANTHLNGSQLDQGNRIENMQSVFITGFWNDTPEDQRPDIENSECKIGIIDPETFSNEESLSDENIFFYFDCEAEVRFGGRDFVVTSYTLNDQTFELTEQEIQEQLNAGAVAKSERSAGPSLG